MSRDDVQEARREKRVASQKAWRESKIKPTSLAHPDPVAAGSRKLMAAMQAVDLADAVLGDSGYQYRARSDDRSDSWWEAPDQDGLWCDDREEAEDAAELLRALGSTGVYIECRSDRRG